MRIGFMLHSVLDGNSWDYAFLATPMKDLARLVDDLKARGYTFVMAREWGRLKKGKFASITFDDGYLDNWTILFPWMRDHGVPFSVFINRDFVENSTEVRPFGARLPGYLNTAEVRAMADSGVVDFQSHSCTHTWYPISGRVVDIYNSGMKGKYPWIQWNGEPSKKSEWLTYTSDRYEGYPVFENDRSLRAVRYLIPDEAAAEYNKLVSEARMCVAEANELFQSRFASLGRCETDDEARERYMDEIVGNGDFIFKLTGVKPTILCWPGGAYNKISHEVSDSLGLITTSRVGFGVEDRFMHRISPTNHYGKDRWPWRDQALTLSYYLARYRINALFYRLRNALGDS